MCGGGAEEGGGEECLFLGGGGERYKWCDERPILCPPLLVQTITYLVPPSPPPLLPDDFKYQVTVKSCEGEGASTVLASLCSESRCNDTIGDVVSFKLTSGGRGGSGNKGKWKTTQISADFNPVAMELSNDEGSSW